MVRRLPFWRRLLLGTFLFSIFSLLSCSCFFPSTISYFKWKYYQIEIGMSLGEVEKSLGKGQERKPGPLCPAISGAELYSWGDDGMAIWVGVTDGKVESKCFEFTSM
jgi:hypothetical protein